MGKSNKRKRDAKAAAASGNPSSQANTQKRAKTAHGDVKFDGNLDEDQPKNLDLDKSAFSETQSTEDRKREAHVYELLGSADISERLAAADALATGLLGGDGSSQAVLERHLEKRLFRGLASSRNASRVGFSLVLTEILSQLFGAKKLSTTRYPELTFDKVLNILVDKTHSGGNIPGQEERDFFFGQLFGLQCFVEAKILFGDEDESRWAKVLDLLLKIAEKKVWLRSQCGWVIVQALPQMGRERAQHTLQQLSDLGLGKTAEGVGIWLQARNVYSHIKTPAKPWRDPLASGSIPEVARVLKESVKQDTGEDAGVAKQKQSNWTAQLHFVWDLILASFSGSQGSTKTHDKDQFRQFWSTVVDDGLFSKSATDGQKFRGFMLFRKFLESFQSDNLAMIKELFTKNLMACLMNQAAQEDRYLHLAAVKSLKCIEQVVEKSPELLLPILQEVLGKRGAFNFDQRTSSKTVEKLLQFVTSSKVEAVMKLLRSYVESMPKKEETEVENLRQVYGHYILKMVTRPRPATESPESKESDLSLVVSLGMADLAEFAYSTSPSFEPELSQKTREVFRSRLSSALARIAKRRDDFEAICNAVLAVKPTAVTMSSEIQAERDAAFKTIRKLMKASKKSGKSDVGASLGLALLYAVTVLQLYDGAPDAVNILQDLKGVSDKSKDSSEGGGASELLVEILLSLISQPSSMMRQISQQVFEAFTAQMSAEALELLTEPLLTEENTKGYQALFENLDDEEMVDADDAGSSGDDEAEDVEDVEEDDMSEIGSDVEFVNLNGAEPEDEDSGDEEEEDDDEGDADANAEAEELADLDDKLAQILKSRRLEQDEDDKKESDDDESDMTDSEMMALDEKLVEIFKQRSSSKKKSADKKDSKQTVLNFKRRALDLLDIYVRNEAGSAVALGVLLPLLQLVRTTTDKPLSNKAIETISDFSKALKKKARGGDEQQQQQPAAAAATADKETQLELLRAIHKEAFEDPAHAFARAASTASLVLVNSLVAADRANIRDVAAVYAATQADWFGVRRPPVLFSDWLNWYQSQASSSK